MATPRCGNNRPHICDHCSRIRTERKRTRREIGEMFNGIHGCHRLDHGYRR